MYKDYNMTQLTQTSVLIPTNDISRHVNDIIETIPETEFDAFICPNNKRLGFKRYAYRHDKYSFKRDFKLYECDDCSECPLKQQCMNFNSKTNKKIMKNYNRELGFVLMVLNIREVTAQRAENNQKNYNKDNFYIISIEIVFVYLSWAFMSHTPSYD